MNKKSRRRPAARQRSVLDTSVLASIVNSDDAEHFSCYSFFRNLHDEDKAIWVIPGLIFFELQATQSRRYHKLRPGHPVFRNAPLYVTNSELYHVTQKFLKKVFDLKLYDLFGKLKGADLLYACIARVEGLPLVTHDADFDRYNKELNLISPREIYRSGDTPLGIGTVTVRKNDKTYAVGYKIFRGVVQLETGQATQTNGSDAEITARQLLREMIQSGLADRLGLRQSSL